MRFHARDLRGDYRHMRRGHHRKFSARHVAAHGIHGDILMAQHDARQRFDLDIGHRGFLHLGESADLVLGEADIGHLPGRDLLHCRFDLAVGQPEGLRPVAVELLGQLPHCSIAAGPRYRQGCLRPSPGPSRLPRPAHRPVFSALEILRHHRLPRLAMPRERGCPHPRLAQSAYECKKRRNVRVRAVAGRPSHIKRKTCLVEEMQPFRDEAQAQMLAHANGAVAIDPHGHLAHRAAIDDRGKISAPRYSTRSTTPSISPSPCGQSSIASGRIPSLTAPVATRRRAARAQPRGGIPRPTRYRAGYSSSGCR